MSSASRIVSGSVASWMRIGVNIFSQMLLVPIYLTYWEVEVYGIWLSVQSIISILSTLDKGYQNYLGFEFHRFGRDDRDTLSLYLWSGAAIGILLGVLQIVIILLLVYSGLLVHFFDKINLSNSKVATEVGLVLVLQSIAWLISGSVGGIIGRSLALFGYYPRMTWWGVFAGIVTSVAPVIAVMFGADLLIAGAVSALATIAYNIPLYIDMFHLLHKERVRFFKPSWKIGYKTFMSSLLLSGKDLLENLRQQGIRLILTPLIGVIGLAAFSTMRTGANIALQGLGTVTNPLMPELMLFLHKRDQARMEACFGTVWVILVVFLAPGVVVLQVIAPELFTMWVKGKIVFNPFLFALLSLGVLVYAQAQPAAAVMKGNNLVKPLLMISIFSVAVMLVLLIVFVPYLGIVGAGIALLGSEVIATQGYQNITAKWLSAQGLHWPKKSSSIASLSVWIAAGGMFCMSWFAAYKWIVLAVSLVLLALNAYRYWTSLPDIILKKVENMMQKIPFMKNISLYTANQEL